MTNIQVPLNAMALVRGRESFGNRVLALMPNIEKIKKGNFELGLLRYY